MVKVILFKIACLFFAGASDRIRGGWRGPSELLVKIRKWPMIFEGLTYLFMCLAVLPMHDWKYAYMAGIIGGLLAWRQDNGFRGQFVEANVGYDGNDAHRWYGPVRFGALQGLILLPLAVFLPAFAFFIYAAILGQLAALAISEKMFRVHIEKGRMMDIKNAWAGSEFLGAPLTGLFWFAILTTQEALL